MNMLFMLVEECLKQIDLIDFYKKKKLDFIFVSIQRSPVIMKNPFLPS